MGIVSSTLSVGACTTGVAVAAAVTGMAVVGALAGAGIALNASVSGSVMVVSWVVLRAELSKKELDSGDIDRGAEAHVGSDASGSS